MDVYVPTSTQLNRINIGGFKTNLRDANVGGYLHEARENRENRISSTARCLEIINTKLEQFFRSIPTMKTYLQVKYRALDLGGMREFLLLSVDELATEDLRIAVHKYETRGIQSFINFIYTLRADDNEEIKRHRIRVRRTRTKRSNG